MSSYTVLHGDCRDLLPNIGRVQHIITDPPYEAEAHTRGRRLLGRQKSGQRTVEYGALDFDHITSEERDESARLMVAACSGWLLIFCQAEAVAAWRASITAGGGRYMRAMVWIKPDGAPQFTGDRPGMGYESIVAAWCGEGRSRWNGGGRRGVFTHAQRDSNSPKLHMTQKPVALMRELVALFTNPGETVADPYAGSGTTGVAAIALGRNFIGMERELRHVDTACARLDAAGRQLQIEMEA
ncbi:site-specific DNA-methyltransferase, partial [Leptospira sp. 96542]|nr:site-specific DNA-methyltransferase [Leptospira sp. 96542]